MDGWMAVQWMSIFCQRAAPFLKSNLNPASYDKSLARLISWSSDFYKSIKSLKRRRSLLKAYYSLTMEFHISAAQVLVTQEANST